MCNTFTGGFGKKNRYLAPLSNHQIHAEENNIRNIYFFRYLFHF